VKRAAGLVFTPGFFQLYTVVDDLDYVGAGEKFINKGLGDAASHVF
jgi:hypothetical protein